MALLTIEHLTKTFRGPRGQRIEAVRDLTLAVDAGELLALVGPSGCGKTTTLRLIAGLEEPEAGCITLAGRDITHLPAKDRDLAMVFQSPALYPEMTARENLSFGLRIRRVPADETNRRVNEMAELLSLSGCLDRLPMELSGGERQRVALGRALVRRPALLLLDEPLTALDTPIRAMLRAELAAVQQRLGTTMLYVTHDQADAMMLGQRIAVMRDGTLQQVSTPQDVYRNPANRFVAAFFGNPPMNFFRGRLGRDEGNVVFELAALDDSTRRWVAPLPCVALPEDAVGREVLLGLRPQHIRPASSTQTGNGGVAIDAVISRVEHTGADTWLHCRWGGHLFVARFPADTPVRDGDTAMLVADLRPARFFDPVTEQTILCAS